MKLINVLREKANAIRHIRPSNRNIDYWDTVEFKVF